MKAAHQKDDFEEEAAIDVEFHSAIGECAHNIILLHTLELLLPASGRGCVLQPRHGLQSSRRPGTIADTASGNL
jgi:DNA-binding FadR family transcriptional regulator